MATLQKIRSKGALLVIVVGLALFAFIAGDAWKVMQPRQARDVGEINGEKVSAQDYQEMVEEYLEVIKLARGVTSLTDEQINQARDEVWASYVNKLLVEKEAKKLGLVVSDAELQAILKAGVHPLLKQTPFVNQQTGLFDRDMLNKFLVDYNKMVNMPSQTTAAYMDQYTSIYKYWSFVQKTLLQNRLAEKYEALLSQTLMSNPVEAKHVFDQRTNQYDLLLAAVPFSSIPDSTIMIKQSELKDLYNKKKEQYRQYVETRDIKYIDVKVTASKEDRDALLGEMEEAAEQLIIADGEYTSFIRSSGSNVPYNDVYYNKTAFPSDVVTRLDSVKTGGVFGPYENASDNTYNAFKYVAKAMVPDSVEFRQIQVYTGDVLQNNVLADSIYTALKNGADFVDVAKRYGQTGDPIWLTGAQFEGAQLDDDNVRYINAITEGKVKELINLPLTQVNVIIQVTGRKAVKEKYKVAIVKREIEFSKETYNRAYNDFSQFIAANPTVEQLEANAEDAGYRLLERNDLNSAEHSIGGVRSTKDALRWVFDKAEKGDVSGLYECGDSDHLLVVGLVDVKPEGYLAMSYVTSELAQEIVKDKKAEQIKADMKAANPVTFADYAALPGAVTDSVKLVTYSAPAYISPLISSEPNVSAYASVAEKDKLSAPVTGYAGVYVMQMYNQERLGDTYDEEKEKTNLVNTYTSLARRVINDLYLKANVKDQRYLFF